jgi:hypothetical protein
MPRWRWDGATVVSRRKKWVLPSQATLTKPTSRSPSYAQTQSAECRSRTVGSSGAWSGQDSASSAASAGPEMGSLTR